MHVPEHAHVVFLREDHEQAREGVQQPLCRAILLRDQVNAELAEKKVQLGRAARCPHRPDGLRHLAGTAPDTNPYWPGIRAAHHVDDGIRCLAVLASPKNLIEWLGPGKDSEASDAI